LSEAGVSHALRAEYQVPFAVVSQTTGAGPETPIACRVSDGFGQWLGGAGGSLAVTTYQAGKVALVGWDNVNRQVTLLLRQFDKPLGLAVNGPQLALATRHAVLLCADAPLLAPDYLEDQRGRYDALYLPRAAYFTGDINAHDLAFDSGGDLWVVNTRFGCLARLSRRFSFEPAWKPPFVSEIVPEDRCHLNGLAMLDGKPKYVTCLGETDAAGAWRGDKATGGVIVDVDANQVVVRGLSMPHSPRWHDGRLWLLNSGLGELWRVDAATGTHDVVCALPGYLRGLCFVAPHFALIGLCQIREKHLFGGLPVQQRHAELLCGVAAVDLRSGALAGMLEFTSGVQELYDVRFLPGVQRPMILNLEKDATRQAFTAPQFAYWLRPSSETPPSPSPSPSPSPPPTIPAAGR
jgi:uncharacterized protein (TIGR03032 family)